MLKAIIINIINLGNIFRSLTHGRYQNEVDFSQNDSLETYICNLKVFYHILAGMKISNKYC